MTDLHAALLGKDGFPWSSLLKNKSNKGHWVNSWTEKQNRNNKNVADLKKRALKII